MDLLFAVHKKSQTRPSLEEISNALKSAISLYSRVFIVVDALDECRATDGCRTGFLKQISKLQKSTKVNFFATSRSKDDILNFFDKPLSMEIRATDRDIETFLNARMPLIDADLLDDSVEETIRSEIKKASAGMYDHSYVWLDAS